MTTLTDRPLLISKEFYKEKSDDVMGSFKLAMRQMAACVHVITTEHENSRAGITATAVQSVSFDPMSMLCCVNETTALHDKLLSSGRFCINMLQSGQEDISNNFSGKLKGEERFSVGDWQQTADGLPYLNTAQANFFCETAETIKYGTHTIFIGKVIDVKVRDDISPLMYMDGAYRS
ncbi:MAG: hypothetical protein CMF31_07765 [Kordiimonas sp.]|nr:hypothetical protein [Kordiimonas sp.]|tara:strand:- start:1881 stop:2411 length:531 start_codon:yes stop_codon:yes gene_type:complete